MLKTTSKTKSVKRFPAVCVVHWPSGPVNACASHARGLRILAETLGAHVAITKLAAPAECVNCKGERIVT